MALPQKSSRMLKQLMTTLKDDIYDADSPHMQKEKEEQIRNPKHVIERKSRSGRCLGNPRFRPSYTPQKQRVRVVMEPESDAESDSVEEDNAIKIESSEEETDEGEVEQEESSVGTEVKSPESPTQAILKRFCATVRGGGIGFLKLPLEMRNEVYKQLLYMPGGVEIQAEAKVTFPHADTENVAVPAKFTWAYRDPQDGGPESLHVEILRVCSFVHAEAVAILYGHNIIQVDDVSNVVPFFSSLSPLARLVVGQVEICHNHGPRYLNLHDDLLEQDVLKNELHFMATRWKSTLFYLAVNLKLKKLDISTEVSKDEYEVERALLRGAFVRCHDEGYTWTAEFGDLRPAHRAHRDAVGVAVEVKLTVEAQAVEAQAVEAQAVEAQAMEAQAMEAQMVDAQDD